MSLVHVMQFYSYFFYFECTANGFVAIQFALLFLQFQTFFQLDRYIIDRRAEIRPSPIPAFLFLSHLLLFTTFSCAIKPSSVADSTLYIFHQTFFFNSSESASTFPHQLPFPPFLFLFLFPHTNTQLPPD